MLIYDPKDLLLGHTKCFMSPHEAQAAALHVAEQFGMPTPVLVFESAPPDGVLAVTVQPATSRHTTIQYEDRGCTIELLAHELAHAVEFANDDERSIHDDAFGVLVCLVGWIIMEWLVSTWPWAHPVPLITTYLNRSRDIYGSLPY